MAVYKDEVVYEDPTCLDASQGVDVLSASPAYNNGRNYGIISVTHGAKFVGDSNRHGATQSVCVEPGRELRVLAALGDKLRGVRDGDANGTIVVTVDRLRGIAMRLGLSEEQALTLCRQAAKPVRAR